MTNPPTTAIINAVILRPGESPSPGGVLLSGGKIKQILSEGTPVPESVREVIDARSNYLAPGFIDLHLHGGGGHDFAYDGGRNSREIIEYLARFGTTALLPTIATSSRKNLLKAVRHISTLYSDNKWGVLGINLEGPYLSIGKRGAQPLRFIRRADKAELDELLESANGAIKIMTLAPEIEGGMKLIRWLKNSGIIPAAGHTTADYETMKAAIRAGISYATHIFNSYPPLNHRNPGAIGAILESEKINTEIICDGIHVSPVLVRLLFMIKPLDRLLVVTDGTAVMGRRIKKFIMGEREVIVDHGGARMADGTLVGSMLPMNRALCNVAKFNGIPLSRALIMATINPARLLGVEDRKGDIRKNMDADLVIMDKMCNVKRTIIAGETVYRRK
ncbi:MAG: N-acetylglucosamine-6-phosphate deacetylase [Candidatus Auribacterota bacterium]|nr:N-acetylglucosamine-6-phosphate deacetylase [Candidatus Auribacterota bacterium]